MKLLHIRQIQLKKEIQDVGPGILLLLAILGVLINLSYSVYCERSNAYYLTVFLFLVCLVLQFSRKDKLFVYTHIDHPQRELFSEYLVLTFPFAVPCIFTTNWFCYPILIAALTIIPFFKFTVTQKNYFKNSSGAIQPANFEWISGIRKSFIYIVPLYSLALLFCWFRFLPLILLWCITVTITSFYTECEPLQILKARELPPKEFLKQKMFQHSKYIVIFYVPIILINTFFNREFWEMNLFVLPTHLALVCFAICLKYSNYQPNQRSIANGIILALVSTCTIIPYLLPVPLLMAFTYYKKAKTNLDNYLDD